MAERYCELYQLIGKTIKEVEILYEDQGEPRIIGIVGGTPPTHSGGEAIWNNLGYIILEADHSSQYYSEGSGGYYNRYHFTVIDCSDHNWEYKLGVISEEEYIERNNKECDEHAARMKIQLEKERQQKISSLKNSIERQREELAKLQGQLILELSGEN